jgi:DNA-binding NtrC family response regulator
MNRFQNVLILDDEPGFRNEIGEYLTAEGYKIIQAGLPSQAIELIESNPIDIAVFDIRLPEMDGLTLLQKIKRDHPHIEVVMMTGFGDMDVVIKALRLGAIDFFKKPFKLEELKAIIERTLKFRNIKRTLDEKENAENEIVKGEIRMIGQSPAMKNIQFLIQKISASSDTTVLISGESGSGKELVARGIHYLGPRKNDRFLPVNCSTIPEELFENEFFGHSRGSYTDAKQDQKGLFEIADKGTLFLDEIGDLKYSMQAKLLRVIEDKKISRIGQFAEKKVDVRIITATNQDLEQMVENKLFRKDLYHRLNLFRIDIPPLRYRKEDIPLLFDFFIADLSKKLRKPIQKIEKSVIAKLMDYDFPGNVRELKHLIERAVIMCDKDVLSEKSFGILDIPEFKNVSVHSESHDLYNLYDLEKDSILKAMKKTKNNKSKAARLLNISRQALDRKMKKLNINPSLRA